jgi:hypothetical protein
MNSTADRVILSLADAAQAHNLVLHVSKFVVADSRAEEALGTDKRAMAVAMIDREPCGPQ